MHVQALYLFSAFAAFAVAVFFAARSLDRMQETIIGVHADGHEEPIEDHTEHQV